MASLDPEYRGGRPRRITSEQRRQAVAVAGARPDTEGVALTRWSLPRLADHLAESGLVEISAAHLGRVLAEAGLSFQRTRTWKASPDPDYETKAARVLELRATPPADGGHVIAFDQMGPLSLRPMAGAGWAPRGRPERQRATYHRRHGTRYVFGAYDVHHDRLRVRLRPRRRGSDNLAFMTQIRAAIPARRRIYWIQDNLSRQLDTRHPRLRRQPPDRAGRDPDLRQLPQPGRVPLLPDHRVCGQQRRLRRLGRLRLGARPPRLPPQRPTPRQAHPPPRSPSPDRRLMPLPVKRFEKPH